ncbi:MULTISPECIES: GNAT family N-acetyltransferase [Chromobacterium]|uniref:GNAT family N-acetyltransferase n=1 Tax=Chromobacterium TaxID=535 RepID=UPI001889A672|nr:MULTISPECIES: GNAT family N-acetyltransferase [Chromobacterium]QOZ85322.1 GNAT family N-acetyltransferase [Chromobacterium sp. Rain0013]WON85537.1 GNAT family N-acetyltransferase [Chromobacterium haemolyticum]
MHDLLIRKVEPEDAPALAAMMVFEEVVANTLQLPYQSVEDWRRKLAQAQPHVHSLVACNSDGRVIGNAGLICGERPRIRHTASLFIVVHPEWHGRGVGSALLRAVLGLADNWLGLLRVELVVVHDNEPAIALYRKFGFELEGRRRKEQLRAGRYEDTLIMARLRGLE